MRMFLREFCTAFDICKEECEQADFRLRLVIALMNLWEKPGSIFHPCWCSLPITARKTQECPSFILGNIEYFRQSLNDLHRGTAFFCFNLFERAGRATDLQSQLFLCEPRYFPLAPKPFSERYLSQRISPEMCPFCVSEE